jgi:hypothetical protein
MLDWEEFDRNFGCRLILWITGNQNAFLVKRSSHGGIQFSKDPYNLVNLNSRKVGSVRLDWNRNTQLTFGIARRLC